MLPSVKEFTLVRALEKGLVGSAVEYWIGFFWVGLELGMAPVGGGA